MFKYRLNWSERIVGLGEITGELLKDYIGKMVVEWQNWK